MHKRKEEGGGSREQGVAPVHRKNAGKMANDLATFSKQIKTKLT